MVASTARALIPIGLAVLWVTAAPRSATACVCRLAPEEVVDDLIAGAHIAFYARVTRRGGGPPLCANLTPKARKGRNPTMAGWGRRSELPSPAPPFDWEWPVRPFRLRDWRFDIPTPQFTGVGTRLSQLRRSGPPHPSRDVAGGLDRPRLVLLGRLPVVSLLCHRRLLCRVLWSWHPVGQRRRSRRCLPEVVRSGSARLLLLWAHRWRRGSRRPPPRQIHDC